MSTPLPKNRLAAFHRIRNGGSITKPFVGGVSCLTNEPHKFLVMVSQQAFTDKKLPRRFFVLFYSDLYGGLTVDITLKQVLSFIRRNFPR